MEYAARSDRVIGQIYDGLIAVVPVLGLYFAEAVGPTVFLIAALGCAAWSFLHIILADGLEGGQSWGKRAAGTRVIDAESGKPCTMGQAFVRNICLSILGPIDWIFILGARHQRLGDKLAGTVVVPAAEARR
jgi:uncharacterized RDD family membrane protein YckC